MSENIFINIILSIFYNFFLSKNIFINNEFYFILVVFFKS